MFLHVDIFFLHFCLGISEEDDLLVKYLSCRMCLFLSVAGLPPH